MFLTIPPTVLVAIPIPNPARDAVRDRDEVGIDFSCKILIGFLSMVM